MKLWNKIMGATIALVMSSSAWALNSDAVVGAGFSDLTDQQKAEIVKYVADKAAANKNTVTAADEVDKWVVIGERFGKGIGAAAKELGVAANEFVQTPVGAGVAFLVMWNFFGDDFLHILFGVVVMTVGFMSLRFYIKMCRAPTYTYDSEKTDIFGRARVKSVVWHSMSEGETFIAIIGLVATMGLSLGIIF